MKLKLFKTKLICLLFFVFGWSLNAFSVNQPNSGSSTSFTVTCGTTYNYYDQGGSGGNYSNSQSNSIITFTPSTAGQLARIVFTSFDIEVCGGASCTCDFIRIYDGTTTGASLIGKYCNGNIPGTITSTTGSLTVEFYSDGGTVGSGWAATVSCYSPCATVAGTSSSSVTSSCVSTNTTLSLSGEGAGSIQWQQSTNGGSTWTNISGATTDPYVYSASVTTMFRAAVTNGCTNYSSTSSITFSCPDIIHPSSGTSSTTIQCGGSYTYKDPGNTGDYGDDQNGLITICPDTPGKSVRIQFGTSGSFFNTESGYDYFYVFDGYDAHAPLLGVYSGNGGVSGTIKATASNASGCLSFRFFSDGATTEPGWQATISCANSPSATVPSTSPQDCQGAIVVCGNSALVGGSSGIGMHELPYVWSSCLGIGQDPGENESTWYVFSPSTSGKVGFQITPNSPTDYDWAIWGPYDALRCPAFTNDAPLRCSATQLLGNGNTGLVAPATDTWEQNVDGDDDGFLKPIDVLAGEVYVMMIDNWSASTVGFQLNWNLTSGASLDCAPVLPVNLVSFSADCKGNNTVLRWNTETETNNDYFAIEKSDEDFKFYEIGRVNGAGNSNVPLEYAFEDHMFNSKTAYYRLKQVDYDGEVHYHRIVASNCHNNEFEVSNLHLSDSRLEMIISSSSNEEVMIYLYDNTGKQIVQKSAQINVGNNKFKVSDLNLNSGIYFINIVGSVNKYSGKLLKE